MDRFLDDIQRAYDREIQIPGKELAFLILVAFLFSFGFIRTSAHMIRAQVSWWPGNVETGGGTHIHHLVWGILLMMVFGYVGIAIADDTPVLEISAILFGIGMGLTMDEFALWLNLQDVYWSEKGRQSIDAVVIASLLLVVGLLGLSFWIDLYRAGLVLIGVGDAHFDRGDAAVYVIGLQLSALAFAIVCFAKGKVFTGLAGIGIPLVALIGSIRLAKPHSLWGRRYTGDKRAKALKRFAYEEPELSAAKAEPEGAGA
ncbi:MAG TPA: hypothetical protein VI111_10955 [Thermoleophilaceae bacterium]